VLVGVAIGVASYAVPLYISEVAPADARGRLVSLNQLAITLGILVAYVVDYAFSASQDWRWMLGLAVAPAVLLGAGMAVLPNSPRWLAGRGQVDVARAVLRRVRDTTDVDDEMDQIVASLQKERGRWSDLLAPAVRPALVVGVGMAIFQQITGINTVIYYAPTIIQSAGISSASGAILQTAGIGLVNVLMTIVAMRLVDGVGRRPLALIGMAGMAVSLALLGLAFRQLDLSGGAGWFAVACLMFYVASFAISLGPIFWLIIAEIYPLKIRGLAMSVATMANWASNLVVSLTFLTLAEALGRSATFWMFGLFTIAAWLFVYFLMPETKGRTLEEIQEFWRRRERPSGADVPADARHPRIRPHAGGRASAA
jgi:MFS transporter, SP family, galactose:H+ symporter